MEPKTRFPISRESCLSRNNRLLPVTVTDKLSCWHGKNANAAQPAAPIRQQVGGTNRAAILHRLYIMVTLADQLVVFKLTVLLLNTRAKILREHRVSNWFYRVWSGIWAPWAWSANAFARPWSRPFVNLGIYHKLVKRHTSQLFTGHRLGLSDTSACRLCGHFSYALRLLGTPKNSSPYSLPHQTEWTEQHHRTAEERHTRIVSKVLRRTHRIAKKRAIFADQPSQLNSSIA